MDSKSVYLPAVTQNGPYADEVQEPAYKSVLFSLRESIIVHLLTDRPGARILLGTNAFTMDRSEPGMEKIPHTHSSDIGRECWRCITE